MDIFDSFVEMLDLFCGNGCFFVYKGDFFILISWFVVMVGQGIEFKVYFFVVDSFVSVELIMMLKDMWEIYVLVVSKMLLYDVFIVYMFKKVSI